MKIVVNGQFVIPAEHKDVGSLLSILTSCFWVTNTWKQGQKYQRVENNIELQIEEDSAFIPSPTPEQALRDQHANLQKMWSEEYNSHAVTKKQLKEAQEKLAALQNTLGKSA